MVISHYNHKTLKDMSEHDNLQEADGKQLNTTPQNDSSAEQSEASNEIPTEEVTTPDTPSEESVEPAKGVVESTETAKENPSEEASKEQKEETETKVNYEDLSLEDLIKAFETLLKSENIYNVRTSINKIKTNFNTKFSALISEKKEAFLSEGGNAIDFQYSNPLKKQFNELSKTFRERHQAFQKNRTQELNQNLEIRLQIIEEIKGLINVEGDINSAYNTFKNLQERWRNTGRIPSSETNNTWNNYRHHVEIFYGFLHLNRDLRDLDYKHNLEKKQKIIANTEALANETDLNRAFRELQALHKIWKEELGPVAKEHKDELWERFSAATKVINDKRQEYYNQLEETFEENLNIKNEIIAQISAISEKSIHSHKQWQSAIK